MDYQRVILLGNTTDQAEVKQAKNGTDYALFSVAVAKGKEETIFFPVTLFGESAKLAGEMLAKGTRVLVEGTLDVDRKTGQPKWQNAKWLLYGSGGNAYFADPNDLYFWQLYNNSLRLMQVRFYPTPPS